jgi:signal transduction histidine kinase
MSTIRPEELRRIDLLRDLPDERLEELATRGRVLELASGEYLFREEEEATFLSLLLEGELETTRTVGVDELPLIHHTPGGFLGAIALVTGVPYAGSTRSVGTSRLFLLDAEAFRALLVSEPQVFTAVMDVFVPVITNFTAIERDRDRLVSLGTLAAGLAHELNNPAAAAQRGASELRAAERHAQAALSQLATSGLDADGMGQLCTLTADALAASEAAPRLDSLDRVDRETELAAWLGDQGAAGSDAAVELVDAGLDEAWLERLLAIAPGEPDSVVAWITSRLRAARITRELESSTTRISQLIQSVKQYSYLDQTPQQEVDVHDGLESTLAILGHKIAERGIEIVRAYDRSLPQIDAHAAELNQVWTNLLDNAVAAANARVTIRTYATVEFLIVEVEDDGAGVPPEIAERVFDAFFTTKEPGEGTGLGLDIARRIVVRHHGELRLKPVETGACFQVLLPLGAG